MRRIGAAMLAAGMIAWGASVNAGIVSAMSYADDTAFSLATGAISLTGPLPDIGNQGTSVTLGNATLSAGNTIFVETGWSTLLPNNIGIAISGVENLDISIDSGLAKAFGFYFHEPGSSTAKLNGCNTTCAVSLFDIAFYRNGAFIDSTAFDPPDDVLHFFGVVLDEAFDEVRFRETQGSNDNEFYGEMYVTAVPEPTSLLLAGLGLAGIGWLTRPRST